ncbi:MAG: rod shape-determining protein RodA [Coriobacteriales bacterium]|jgi:rod shape determining protein RodA|nr:rod shape-determining protein RodA [Coriobacteriales bacterium]
MAITPRMESPKPLAAPGAFSSHLRRIIGLANIPLLATIAALSGYGLLVVGSAIAGSPEYSFRRQTMGIVIGVVLLLIFWRVDYRRFSAWFAPLLVLDIILIISPLLPFIGVTINGARSWVNIFDQQLQPGELAKLVTIVMMAALVSRYGGRIPTVKDYLRCLLILFIPIVLIMLQPDLGTGMVLFAIGAAILFAGGADWKWLVLTLLALVALILLAFFIDPLLDQAAGHDVFLKQYQKNRLLVFMDEDLDPSGVGYNVQQAKIAIGSGGLFGKGLGLGTQSGLGFLPEAPTDFIFCVLAEELGFVGCLGLILLYAALIGLSIWAALRSEEFFGSLAIIGILGMWVFQILENIGMSCGLMPITGIPLPFVSYGSSFMVVNFMALGLILSVWSHRSTRPS